MRKSWSHLPFVGLPWEPFIDLTSHVAASFRCLPWIKPSFRSHSGHSPHSHARTGFGWKDYCALSTKVGSVLEYGDNDRLQLWKGPRLARQSERCAIPGVGCRRPGEITAALAKLHKVGGDQLPSWASIFQCTDREAYDWCLVRSQVHRWHCVRRRLGRCGADGRG